ncbi:hypothetical protein BDQ12DRAFT_731053 [Crucibulum laeve]|uniref:F-box domain-containing protein n=1 Tax=Crucibulum laeve TaxID=68775 RepID=A0A5C3MK75_9AGAR|nr:hypothetical protein BDQ12DRAFT_731053 [Crucibulum laeve]
MSPVFFNVSSSSAALPKLIQRMDSNIKDCLSLSEFPDELLLVILHDVESETDVVALATTCRRFHYLSLEFFLDQCNVSIPSGEISLNSAESIRTLSMLANSLLAVNATLQHLSCDLTVNFKTPIQVILDTQNLSRFISKLYSVRHVSLEMMASSMIEREGAIIDLLKLIMQKSCIALHVKALQRSTFSLGSSSRPLRRTSLISTLTSGSLFDRSRRKQFEVPITKLEVLHIQTPPPFLQSFYPRILAASPQIRELSFKYIFSPENWETLVGDIRLPNLKTLLISHCNLPPDTLLDFLSSHPSITFLEFHHNMISPIHPPRMPPGILPRLERLKSSPEYITYYLPDLSTFHALHSIEISAGNRLYGFRRTDDAFRCIATCANDISLSLEFEANSSVLTTWLNGGGLNLRPECHLRCVKSLNLDNRLRSHFNDDALARFPDWLAEFPALEHVSFSAKCLPDSLKMKENNHLVEAIRRLCPTMRTFQFRSETGWEHSYAEDCG